MALMFHREQGNSATLIFYKPLWKKGGDVDEFLRLCAEFSSFDQVKVVCIYPFFWGHGPETEVFNFESNYSVSNRPVGMFSIFLNILICLSTGRPIEYALFRRPMTNKDMEADVIIGRGSRIFWNIKKNHRSGVKLILADSLGATWQKKVSSQKLRVVSWLSSLYSKLHFRCELKQIAECSEAFVFDDLEREFISKKIEEQSARKSRKAVSNLRNKVKYLKMSWSDISTLAAEEVNPRAVSVFGKHGAAHNVSRLDKLIKYADAHKDLEFRVIGDTDGVPVSLLHQLESRVNIRIVGFIDRFDDLIMEISKCSFSYHEYGWISGMQNTVLMAVNLGQTLIADKNVCTSVDSYFNDLGIAVRLTSAECSAPSVKARDPQPFSRTYLDQSYNADE